MEQLKAKLKKQGGFTLVEMLIVVAIIAILIAISIPLINNALDRAKHATDAANERAAKAEILISYLTDTDGTFDATKAYYYDAPNGKLVADGSGIKPYGKHKSGSTFDHTTKVIAVKIGTNDEVWISWVTPASSEASVTAAGTDLCLDKDVDHT